MSYYSLSRPHVRVHVPPSVKSVLDVGCGEGAFGSELKKVSDCIVWGIEPVVKACEQAQHVLDRAIPGFFEEGLDSIDRKFELICFNDVLEHMVDPWSALELAKDYLEDEGLVMASIPSILHYQEFLDILKTRDFKYTDKGIMDRTHLRFFTKKSMTRMFEESGYQVMEVIGIDPTVSKKMDLISILSFGYLSEMRFPQFVVKARPR